MSFFPSFSDAVELSVEQNREKFSNFTNTPEFFREVLEDFFWFSTILTNHKTHADWARKVREEIEVQDKIEEAKKLLESKGYKVRDLHSSISFFP